MSSVQRCRAGDDRRVRHSHGRQRSGQHPFGCRSRRPDRTMARQPAARQNWSPWSRPYRAGAEFAPCDPLPPFVLLPALDWPPPPPSIVSSTW